MEEHPLQGYRFPRAARYLACVACDVQTASIPAARGIAIREKSAVRPFSIESDPIGCLKHFKKGELEKLYSLDFHFKEVKNRFKKLGFS